MRRAGGLRLKLSLDKYIAASIGPIIRLVML